MKENVEVLKAKLNCPSDEKLAVTLGVIRQTITIFKSENLTKNQLGKTAENLLFLTSILFEYLPKDKITPVMRDFEKVKRS